MTATNTHLGIDAALCGEPLELGDGTATVRLQMIEPMAVDARGLTHGSFVFGAADYAAMLAVNDPNVVLGAAEVTFHAPISVGEEVISRASVQASKGKKRTVSVESHVGEKKVFSGTFVAFVLEQHVLDAQ